MSVPYSRLKSPRMYTRSWHGLGMVVVGEAANGPEALRLAHTHALEVALLDIAMPHVHVLETARRLREAVCQTKSILLTMYKDEPYVYAALQAEAVGSVVKTQASADIVQAIHTALQSTISLSPWVTTAVVQAYVRGTPLPRDPLTSREREIVQRMAAGLGLGVKNRRVTSD